MTKRYVAGLATAIFLATGISFAGTVNSSVTTSGNATEYWYRYWGNGGNGNGWSGFYVGNDVGHGYSYSPGSGQETNTYTWLEVALPSLTGNITSAVLYIDVLSKSTDDPSGIYAALYHTGNASSATGNAAADHLTGDTLVQNIAPAGLGLLGLNVTSFIQSDYSSHYSWAAFQFNPVSSNPVNSDFSFGTAEPPTVASDAPYLVITTDAGASVPEPATLSVAGVTLLAFGLVSRRRRNRRA